MKKILIYTLLLSTTYFTACVSQKTVEDLEERLAYYQEEAEDADSLRLLNQNMHNVSMEKDAKLKNAVQELERVSVANQSLNQNYQDLLDRYNALLEQNKNMLSTSTYEKRSLQEQLAAQQAELDQKAQYLANLEYELQQREARLNQIERGYTDLEGDLAERNKRIMELESMVNTQEQRMSSVRETLRSTLRGFSSEDLSVTEKFGKIYVSLSQNLLFRSGSDRVDPKGVQALTQLAGALNQNPDVEIMVEGHTDTDGSAAANWDLSVQRATSVVKVLTANGVDPTRVIASGRAFYLPVAPNDSEANKAKNRRTEIILSPKLDQLYELIGSGQN
jgi:chemotaxis protein MotB